MSVRLTVKWEGVDSFQRHLIKTLPEAFKKSLEEALDKTAKDARDRAKQLVPVDTGSLQKSIRVERHAWPAGNIIYTGIRAGGYVVNPRSGKLVGYARHVEYGTSRQRPQPFIRPSLRWASRRIPSYFWAALSKRVDVK